MSADISFKHLVSWENLWLAYHKAAKGKRGRLAAATFELKLADHLIDLRRELIDGSYRPGAYHHFYIHEPKRRKISAAPFRDRVVHHALCNVIEPHFEKRFYPHSYANRKGKGTHRAIDQLQTYTKQYRYVLRLDIIKHFPSINHQILSGILFKQVHDEQIRELIGRIIASGAGILADEHPHLRFPGDDSSTLDQPCGLPIGNLTSQFWSNCYLNPLDWFIVRQLRCKAYIRYVDDFALFSDSKKQLQMWQDQISERLADFRLHLHPTQVNLVVQGVPWLGWIVFPDQRRLKQQNVKRFRQRLSHRLELYQQGEISLEELDASVQGWINHVRYGETWHLRQAILSATTVPQQRED